MNFAQPIFLWSLAAISIPVAIHLLSRREGKVLKVGSLRHIGESNTSRFKSLRLNEIWLLFARCMMIACLALLLSGAQCTSPGSKASSKWLLMEQGIHKNTSVAMLIDSIKREGFEARTLAEGFQAYDEDDSTSGVDYWGLLEQLRDKQDHEIIVLSYSYIKGFTQERISQPSNILWISVDPGEKEFASLATRINTDSVATRIGYSDDGGVMYTTSVEYSHRSQHWLAPKSLNNGSILDSVMIQPMDTIKVAIVEDAPYNTDAKVLRAALNVIKKAFFVRISETTEDNAGWTFWFRPGLPEMAVVGNQVSMVPQTSVELIRQTSGSKWEITRRLTPDEAVGSHLVTELAALLKGETGSTRNDIRSMPDKMLWAQAGGPSGKRSDFSPTQDLSAILALLFLISWIAERAMAFRKNL